MSYVLFVLPDNRACQEALKHVRPEMLVKVENVAEMPLHHRPDYVVGVPTLVERASDTFWCGTKAIAKLKKVSDDIQEEESVRRLALHKEEPLILVPEPAVRRYFPEPKKIPADVPVKKLPVDIPAIPVQQEPEQEPERTRPVSKKRPGRRNIS